MIVILEGPDGGGKTTLRKQLVQNGYKYIPNLPREYPNQYHMYTQLFNELADSNAVIERSFISEVVYRIVKQDDKANINLYQIIELLKDFSIKIIYCKTDTAYEDAVERGETYITTPAQHKYLTFVYDTIMSLIKQFTDTQVITYNWKTDNLKLLLKTLRG